MRLLHFRRTFVEKLFAIHAKVELLKRDGRPLGSYARHYYDLFHLAGQEEVLKMLSSREYADIKSDYDRISRAHFPRDYVCPEEMSFGKSAAFYPEHDLSAVIATAYEQQCQVLCYGSYPSWAQVQARFAQMRELL